MTTVKSEFVDQIRTICKKYEVACTFEDLTIDANDEVSIWEVKFIGA